MRRSTSKPVLLLAIALSSALLAQGLRDSRAPGTRRMARLLEGIARDSRPERNPFLNRRRAEALKKRLEEKLPAREELDLRIELGLELLRAGDSTESIGVLEGARGLLDRLEPDDARVTRWLLHQFLAVANLRLGEQENCIAHHTSDSCILPIQAGGVHTEPRGSRAAIQHLSLALAERPDDPGARWLLNLAHMTLGEYPDRVPPAHLIPSRVFASEHNPGRFRDVAQDCGLAFTGLAGGVAVEDFDGDGLLDVMSSSWGLHDQLRYFRNAGDGTYVERTKEAGLEGLTGGLNIVHANYDNDGAPDVLVLRGAWFHSQGHHPNSLLRNLGGGRFEDVTEKAGVLSYHPTQTAAWADYDGDGRLDLFIGNESDEKESHPCELYHNQGDGTFAECAQQQGIANVGFVKGVAWGDYDNDGRPDLYLSRLGETNVLYRNRGPKERTDAEQGPVAPWLFENVSHAAGVTEPLQSFATWFWDYDNDGWLDLLVLSYGFGISVSDVAADYLGLPSKGARPKLYRNRGDGTFEDVTRAMRLDRVLVAMGANYGDLDNDGWLDFYVGTGEPDLSALYPNRMFRSFEGEAFQDVTTSGGFGHVQKGHGIAFADMDQDGDQDIFAVFGGAYEGDGFRRALFENPGHRNHWVTLRLEGTRSNRSAIGARIEVRVPVGKADRAIFASVSTGGSFGSASLEQEIGLGSADRILSVKVRWPSGLTQTFKDVPVDSIVRIREGDESATPVPAKPFRLGGPGR